jgi:hypothetical protein
MSGIAPLHAPPTARLCIQRNLLSQSKRIEIAMSVAFFISWARGASSGCKSSLALVSSPVRSACWLS